MYTDEQITWKTTLYMSAIVQSKIFYMYMCMYMHNVKWLIPISGANSLRNWTESTCTYTSDQENILSSV